MISLETPPARLSCNSAYRLRYWNRLQDVVSYADERLKLQQCLPFTVLKLKDIDVFCIDIVDNNILGCNSAYRLRYWNTKNINPSVSKSEPRCNSAYCLRYWNWQLWPSSSDSLPSCNSTYRLRYWNVDISLYCIMLFCVATVLTVYGIETWYRLALRSVALAWRCNSAYRLRYWNSMERWLLRLSSRLQQHLLFTAYAEEYEVLEK